MKRAYNFNNILYDQIILKNQNNKILIKYLNDNKKTNMYIETPELSIKDINQTKNILSICLYLDSSRDDVEEFIKFLSEVDRNIVSQCYNHKEWFNEDKIHYKAIIRNDDNDLYIKLKISNESINSLKLTWDEEEINLNDLKINNKVKLIINIQGLWKKDNNCGIYIKPYLIKKIDPIDIFFNDSELLSSEDNLEFNLDSEGNSNITNNLNYKNNNH